MEHTQQPTLPLDGEGAHQTPPQAPSASSLSDLAVEPTPSPHQGEDVIPDSFTVAGLPATGSNSLPLGSAATRGDGQGTRRGPVLDSGPQPSTDGLTPQTVQLLRLLVQELHPPKSTDISESEAMRAEGAKKLREPEAYHGNSFADYNRWIRHLDRIFQLKPRTYPTDQDKITYAATFLAGRAESDWAIEERRGYTKEHSWSDFKQLLRDYLENPKRRDWTQLLRLGDLTHPTNLSISQLANKFEELWDELFPFEMTEDLHAVKAQMFILRIRRSIVDKMIKYGEKPKTFQEVVASASYYEQSEKDKAIKAKSSSNAGASQASGKKAVPSSTSNTGGSTSSAKPGQQSNTNKRKASNSNQSGSRKAPKLSEKETEELKKAGRCFHCKKEGHMAHQCPDREKNSQASDGASTKLNTITEEVTDQE
jgi:hypothetical protein